MIINNKKLSIEYIRVIAIIMTITIHVSNIYIYAFDTISDGYFLTSVIYNSLSRLCVPLFLMISGALVINKEYSRKKYFQKIIKFVLLLIFWSLFYYIQKNGFSFENIGDVLVNSFFNAEMTSRHLWYMYAIISVYIALPFIQNMCKNLSKELENLFLILWIVLSGISVIVLPIARYITKSNVEIDYPVPLINAAYYLGYFVCGHILYKRFENTKFTKRKNIICLAVYSVCTFITAFFTYFISIKADRFFDAMTWYKSIFTILATIAIFLLFVANKDFFKSELILKISKYTFGVYLIHIFFFNIMKNCLDITLLNPIIAIPVTTISLYVISVITCLVLSKIPYVKKLIS